MTHQARVAVTIPQVGMVMMTHRLQAAVAILRVGMVVMTHQVRVTVTILQVGMAAMVFRIKATKMALLALMKILSPMNLMKKRVPIQIRMEVMVPSHCL